MKLFLKLFTAKFLQTTLLILLRFFAEKSENKLDDKLIKAVEDALDAK